MKHAIDVTPLDPYLHSVRGSLALHYDDKQAIANQAFAIQRRLEPTRVNLPMEQARAWHLQDPGQVVSLWKEALQRAAGEKSRFPGSSFATAFTYQRVLDTASKDDFLVSAALDLAGGDSSLVVLWARSAPVILLDREMPRLLAAANGASVRQSLFQIWEKRGSKDAASNFGKNHPELDLPPS